MEIIKISENVTKNQWREYGMKLVACQNKLNFYIGDWILVGNKKWGEVYDEAMEITGLKYQTLRNIVSVCNKVQLSSRKDNLDFKHHEVVASLPPERQEQALNKAVESKLSVRQLRAFVNGRPDESVKHFKTCPNCGHKF